MYEVIIICPRLVQRNYNWCVILVIIVVNVENDLKILPIRSAFACLMWLTFALPPTTALGTCQWSSQAHADWTHQYCEGPCRQPQASIPVLSWRRQAGQVLGPGVQQGKAAQPVWQVCVVPGTFMAMFRM